ncbi:MAG: UDP-N-acetylmuramoyl-tripeptide--D-alanyl-D-alanine ligase [Phycisphaeraceae bacterium]|nr:UDP-N-acetylmuramoyl-tripeptide--D-alanyl-D-alanine ligase [Phycisphaeraceae bacterium]
MTEHARFWTPDGIRAAAGGTWLARPDPGSEQTLTGVAIDSRAAHPGNIFIAIKGENTDGHLYVAEAAHAGASLVIVSADVDIPSLGSASVLRVSDTRAALLRLGAAWRRLLEGTRVIAVVGSNGKTTTVRLIDAALGSAMRGSASIKSFNNEIGVPLTILRAKRGDQYLVCEVGTSSPGEIATLSQVVQPDVAVITSIGREHLEFLGSLKGVATEESSVLDHLRPGGLGVVTAESAELDDVLKARSLRSDTGSSPTMIRFGTSSTADIRVVSVEQDEAGLEFTLNDRARFRIPLIGAHNACNAAAAVAVARRLRLSDEDIHRGLASARGESMRLERTRIGDIDLINDAYNANPDSVLAAIDALGALKPKPGGGRVLVLGDMLELGPDGPSLHDDVLRAVAGESGIDRVVLVGPMMSARADLLASRGDRARVLALADSTPEQATRAASMVRPGDVVLLKGSRGMRLERIAEAIATRHTSSDQHTPRSHSAEPAQTRSVTA